MRFDQCAERKIPEPIIPYRAVVFESCDERVRLVSQPRPGTGARLLSIGDGTSD
jgi:hypothetical protein